MEKAIERMRNLDATYSILSEELGEEIADRRMRERRKQLAIPASPERFSEDMREWFLLKGVPVRVFMKAWKGSLDDDQGRRDLYEEFLSAYTLCQKDGRYHTRNIAVFATDSDE